MKMNRSILMASALLCCLNARAIDATRGAIGGCNWTPLQLSVAPPAQLFSSSTRVHGLRLNLLMGYNCVVDGLDIGTLFNQASDLSGIQIAFVNQAIRLSGLQVGFMNTVGFLGPPYIPGLPSNHVDVTPRSRGFQIGVLNAAGRGSPVSPDDVPLVSFSGLQMGIVNFADEMKGVQVGTLMNQADRIIGLQISLFMNKARELHGVQIGLLNRADNGLLINYFPGEVYGLPIINWVF